MALASPASDLPGRRVPALNLPLALTALRLLLVPVFLWLIWIDTPARADYRPHRFWALSLFCVMAATDKLDGTLARRWNQITRLGTMLDPMADKILVACSVLLLSFPWAATSEYAIPRLLVVIIYIGYGVVLLGALGLALHLGGISIVPRPLGKLNTVLQLVLVICTLLALDLGAWGHVLRPVLHVLWWIVGVVAVVTCIDYARHGIGLFSDATADRVQGDHSGTRPT